MKIRTIQPSDNRHVEKIIRDTFIEYGLPLKGTAYEDKDTSMMYEAYQKIGAKYFILDVGGEVMGGIGFQPLNPNYPEVGEIQKMYFSSKVRGLGYGKMIFEYTIEQAKKAGYKALYLETLPELEAAIHIYKKYGFEELKEPMGCTGHGACGVWMLKKIDK